MSDLTPAELAALHAELATARETIAKLQPKEEYGDGPSIETEFSSTSKSGTVKNFKAAIYWRQTKVAAFATSAALNLLSGYHYILNHLFHH